MKDEKYKPASPRQVKRILQLIEMVAQLKLGRGKRLPPLEDVKVSSEQTRERYAARFRPTTTPSPRRGHH